MNVPSSPSLHICLIGHYPNDRQQSMERFDALILKALREKGDVVALWRPPVFFGKLKRGAEGIGKWLGYLDKFLVFPLVVAFRLTLMGRRAKDWLFLFPDHSHGPYLPLFKHLPHVVHVHDLIAIRTARGEFPGQRLGKMGRCYQKLIAWGLSQAKHFICISEASQHDLMRVIRPKTQLCEVVHNELNYPYERSPSDAQGPKMLQGLDHQPFLLHVGNRLWYKNRSGVLRIFQRYLHDHQPSETGMKLVVVGDPASQEDLLWLREQGIEDRVMWFQGVDCEALQWLYSNAIGLLFPSHYEGFGWPIIEALACGCPVLTTRLTPMTEVGGAVADYLEPIPETSNTEQVNAWLTSAITVINQWRLSDQSANESGIHKRMAHAQQFAVGSACARYLVIYRAILHPLTCLPETRH